MKYGPKEDVQQRADFVEALSKYGYLYKWWAEFDGSLRFNSGDRFIDHCQNIGILYHATTDLHLSYEEYFDMLKYVVDTRGKPLERWSFYFDHAAKRAIFTFTDENEAMTFRLRCP